MILKGYIFAILYAMLCLAVSFVAYKFGLKKKYSRKLVHILVGAEWIILYRYVGATYHFVLVCIFFLALLSLAYFKNMMPMISSENENAPGTVYYAVAMTLMSMITLFIPEMMLPFGIGVFCTSLGDGFAGFFGQLIKKYNPKIYRNKSLFGSVFSFLFSSGTAMVFRAVFDMNLKVWHCVMIGLLSSVLEIITGFGLDNITITFGTAFLSYAFLNYGIIEIFIVPIVLTPLIIAVVIEKRILTRGGLAFAIALDIVVSLIFGNFGFLVLASFLFGSVAVDKIKDKIKTNDDITQKGDCRDAIQVVANGLIPLVMAILYSITLNKAFIVGYVAALAEAFADTSASGIGAFSKVTFDIFKMKKAEKGLSGGMSLCGTVSSLVGAVLISFIGFLFVGHDYKLLIIASIAAFLGAVFDSFLGSLFQVKYKCRVCSKITEKEVHCKRQTEKCSGFEFFDNDVVNLLSGAFAALLSCALYILI